MGPPSYNFITEEAVRVATAALGAEPPHAQYMRTIYRR
jgi:hypothetical protein